MLTTLRKIKDHKPCSDGWTKLLKSLNKTKADDEPLSILHIIKSNGIEDAIWCLRAVEGHDRTIRLFAVWCARQVQHLIKDPRSLKALEVAEAFANGLATEGELKAASDAASAAASAAAWTAWDAAWAAASAAVSVTVIDVARAAAWAAAWAASDVAWAASAAARDAARENQKMKLIEMIDELELKGNNMGTDNQIGILLVLLSTMLLMAVMPVITLGVGGLLFSIPILILGVLLAIRTLKGN